MRAERERPYGNANFLVDLGHGDASGAGAGFCEVVFPQFRLAAATASASPTTDDEAPAGRGGSPHLILRRGVTGALDLYAWWDKARRGKAPRQRTVKVALLAEDHASVVLTWTFRGARPVSLSYSPLNALQGTVLMETIELAFDAMEMR